MMIMNTTLHFGAWCPTVGIFSLRMSAAPTPGQQCNALSGVGVGIGIIIEREICFQLETCITQLRRRRRHPHHHGRDHHQDHVHDQDQGRQPL